MRRSLLLLVSPWWSLAAQTPEAAYSATVAPYLTRHCFGCHNPALKTAGLDLMKFRDPRAALAERDVWEKVAGKIRSGEMPPAPAARPDPAAAKAVERWAEAHVDSLDRKRRIDPGRVTARRLNRAEYNATVRDLLGVSFRPADDFPLDDSGYGFDNIGDVLSVNPALMEKYLAAADQLARAAIAAGPVPKAVVERYELERMGEPAQVVGDPEAPRITRRGSFLVRHRFSHAGDYEIRAYVRGRGRPEAAPSKLVIMAGGRQYEAFDVEPVVKGQNPRRMFECTVRMPPGDAEAGAAWLYPGPMVENKDRHNPAGPNMWVDAIEVRGPFARPDEPSPESRRRIFVCEPEPGRFDLDCARKILAAFLPRAWRRPVAEHELDRMMSFVALAQKEGDTFDQAIQLAVKAALVSPNFLFRIEREAGPGGAGAERALNDYELASRLSYFLWSSMPDEELFRLAAQKQLGRPAVLAAQVKRMLADGKSSALAENFGGQWLELRNLNQVSPDPRAFPDFDTDLREAMRRETTMFLAALLREDRPVLDLINGNYTFLNERLAGHYGIPGIEGRQFRRVELDGVQRSGVITQASVLTISSHPNRTSPVLRGIWILENFLASPPPAAPANVPQLKEAEIGKTMSLRQQMERHRADPNCAVCHTKMDQLGFGLENYDPVGRWRTRDGNFDIDPVGELPGGQKFTTPAEMKAILLEDKENFVRCLTEKLMTYALGRGLESYDKPVVRSIGKKVAANGYRISSMILEIVQSPPFRMRRGEEVRPTVAGAGGNR